MKCTEISADWAAQRIQGLSLMTAIISALKPKFLPHFQSREKCIKSLTESFRYPKFGPGMLWESCARKIEAMGGLIIMGSRVTKIAYRSNEKIWEVCFQSQSGESSIYCRNVISTAPIHNLMNLVQPRTCSVSAAENLKYRDFIMVALIVKEVDRFSDDWIYMHDPAVRVGRIQNFRSWSPEMVPEAGMSCYGLEYFCNTDDQLWNKPDAELIKLAQFELAKIGLADESNIIDDCVVRQHKAYPVYDSQYADNIQQIRNEIKASYPNLHLIGRNGIHKYNNQDHSMMTALLTVKNILSGKEIYDVWNVNQDAEYHEDGQTSNTPGSSGLRQTPMKLAS